MKRFLVSTALAVLAYLVCATILFHDVLAPVGFVFFWNDRLEPQYWRGAAIAGLVVAVIGATVTWLNPKGRVLAPAVFVAIAMIVSIAATALTVDQTRKRLVAEFKPDRVFQNSLWHSLREAPRDYQFYLPCSSIKGMYPLRMELSANGILSSTAKCSGECASR